MNITDLPYQTNTEFLFRHLSELPHCVWLDSGKPLSVAGRYDILSALPTSTVSADHKQLCAVLEEKLGRHANASPLPFSGGWIGHLNYDFRHGEFGLPRRDGSDGAWFGWYDWAVVVDHELRKSQLLILKSCPKHITERALQTLHTAPPAMAPHSCSTFRVDEDRSRYVASIGRIQDYLSAGDCYQVNYTQRFTADFAGDARSAYLQLRQAVPSPFCAYLALENSSVLCISPERFVQLNQRKAIAQPIKGTTRRGDNEQEDLSLRRELVESVKNRAENVMIVDLLRNDFGKLCVPGSVSVPQLFEVESFANVHHLVSTVSGQLSAEVSHPRFILSCFPGGSITGAPKKRAMEVIDELELHSRSSYCGSIGYFSCNGHSDFNIAIRTMVRTGGKIHAWAGGGIVMDSIAQAEYEECFVKINHLIKALEAPAAEV